jgi:hypothetical protein
MLNGRVASEIGMDHNAGTGLGKKASGLIGFRSSSVIGVA